VVDSPAAECDGGITSVLLFAETSEHHRIPASIVFETPALLQSSAIVELAKVKGEEVVRTLVKQLDPPRVVDEYLLDQIIIFMALATSGLEPRNTIRKRDGRRCEILVGEMSSHAQTAIKISEIMLRSVVFRTEYIDGVGTALACEGV
jgi:RNA 3'-terminal phosphate cyclase